DGLRYDVPRRLCPSACEFLKERLQRGGTDTRLGLEEHRGVWIALDVGGAKLQCGIELASVVGVSERPHHLHVLPRHRPPSIAPRGYSRSPTASRASSGDSRRWVRLAPWRARRTSLARIAGADGRIPRDGCVDRPGD